MPLRPAASRSGASRRLRLRRYTRWPSGTRSRPYRRGLRPAGDSGWTRVAVEEPLAVVGDVDDAVDGELRVLPGALDLVALEPGQRSGAFSTVTFEAGSNGQIVRQVPGRRASRRRGRLRLRLRRPRRPGPSRRGRGAEQRRASLHLFPFANGHWPRAAPGEAGSETGRPPADRASPQRSLEERARLFPASEAGLEEDRALTSRDPACLPRTGRRRRSAPRQSLP